MKEKKWLPRTAAAVLVTVTLLGVAMAAGQQGTESDPLVTLSYLTQKAAPELLAQVDDKLAKEEERLGRELDKKAASYVKEMEDKLSKASGGEAESSAFAVVDVAAGQTFIGGVGCEIMLRVGSAVCVTPATPGLIDMTDGSTLENGGALVKNHLYMVTVADRGFTAKEAVKVLVRGDFTIQ